MTISELIRKRGKASIATAIPAIPATQPAGEAATVARIATVAVANPKEWEREPAGFATATPAAFATVEGEGGRTVARIATVAVANPSGPLPAPPAADLPATDPDRWAWPRSDAMNGQEIATLMARQSLFHQRGVSPQDAERLADSLVKRDRSDDDRRLCLECKHLRGAGTYRCGNAKAAWVHPELARDFAQTLQRCNGYEDAGLPIGVKVDAAPPAPPAPAPAQPTAPPAPTGPTWRELDKAYLAHHAQCPTCQSAGRGYGKRCGAGAALWTAYSGAKIVWGA